MPLAAYRAKQSTDTTGTGAITLNVASTTSRSFNAAYGSSSRRIQYVISWATGYEIGLGDYDGGIPGTLTRSSVLASSNSGALVSLPSGTKDVFVAFIQGERVFRTITADAVAALADLGGTISFTGSTTSTLTLPAVATVPPGSGLLAMNNGTSPLTIDGNSAETIDGAATILVQPGESCELFVVAGAWLTTAEPGGWRRIGSTVFTSAQSAVTFSLPSKFFRFRLEFLDFSPTVSAAPFIRMSFNGGSSYASGATDYTNTLIQFKGSTVTVATADALAGLLGGAPGTEPIFGSVEFQSAGRRFWHSEIAMIDVTGGAGMSRWDSSGLCNASSPTVATDILMGFVGTTCAAGRVRLLGGV